ncbi:MAG: RDD family protein [Steroidobacteraceae bacterium]
MSAIPTASPADRLRVGSITGVPIELPIAGPGGRSFAFIIDWHIRVLIAAAWMFPMGVLVYNIASDGTPVPAWLERLAWLPPLLIYLLYHPVLEILMAGRTPGKRIAGVRIVTAEGTVPSAGALLVRNLFRFIDGLPAFYVIGLAFTVMTARNQRIGDLAAGTLLVYDESGKAENLDDLSRAGITRGISTPDAELVQDLLERWETLDPAQRVELARRLLNRLDPAAAAAHGAWLNDGNAFDALQKWLGRNR